MELGDKNDNTRNENIIRKRIREASFFISTKDTADFLGISKSSVLKKTETGELKSIRSGRLVKIPKECLIEYVLNAM
ncbi:helix-turn-helix domain-containing protein [Fusobacterium periodonticum]|uniref:helix-turn-helix domain-containing protein n=1 Tax=Fusobacterium periodonticum TaxID=860 RepID=UPI0028D4551D|nr:helix-turn-helix domain-containing protein [Fusobacterium periodonticum]